VQKAIYTSHVYCTTESLHSEKPTPEDGNRANYRNVVHIYIKYISDKGQGPTQSWCRKHKLSSRKGHIILQLIYVTNATSSKIWVCGKFSFPCTATGMDHSVLAHVLSSGVDRSSCRDIENLIFDWNTL